MCICIIWYEYIVHKHLIYHLIRVVLFFFFYSLRRVVFDAWLCNLSPCWYTYTVGTVYRGICTRCLDVNVSFDLYYANSMCKWMENFPSTCIQKHWIEVVEERYKQKIKWHHHHNHGSWASRNITNYLLSNLLFLHDFSFSKTRANK